MKKVIGVLPLWDEKKDSLWMLPAYLEGIQENGGVPIIFPFSNDKEEIEQLCSMCDGFLFTGGQDVDPALYNEDALDNVEICAQRDILEQIVLDYALKNNKAILGICRGIQFINVALGGTLYQDIPTQYDSKISHSMRPPYDKKWHNVSIVKDSPLYSLLNMDVLGVNSCHHQAVKEVASELKVMSISEDGLVEAVYMPEMKFVWAMQWHPEFLYRTDENSQKVFKEFVEQC